MSRGHVAFGVPVEDHQRIYGVIIHCVNVAVLGINIKTALKFDLGIQPGNEPLRLGEPCGWRSCGSSIVDQDLEQVLVAVGA